MAYYSTTVRDHNKAPIPGALVAVVDYAGNTASLTDNFGNALDNPVVSNALGEISFNAVNGRYKLSYYVAGREYLIETGVVIGDIIAAIDPSPTNAGKYVALDADGNPTYSFGTGADAGLRTDIAALTGAALIGANDGASGSIFTSVQGFINKLFSSAGSSIVGFLQLGTGAVTRTMQDKSREIVSVKDFGAKGDGTTDDTIAIQKAIDYVKSLPAVQAGAIGPAVPYFAKSGALFFPAGLYLVTNTLWFGIAAPKTDVTNAVGTVFGDGAVIVGQTSGKPVVDLTGAFGAQWTGITIFGSPTNSPNVGILLARAGDVQPGDPDYPNNPSSGAHRFVQVNVHGDFTLASVYNYASEINYWTGCYTFNASGKFCYVNTCDNSRYQIVSAHATVAQTVQSAYGDFFTGCFFKLSTANASGEAVIALESVDFGPSIYNSYIDTTGSASSANILFRNAASLTPDQTAAITQGTRIVGNTFEFRSTADIIALYDSAQVVGLTFQDNAAPANTSGGRAHIVMGANSLLRNLDVQKSSGDTTGEPTIITKASGATLLDEDDVFRQLNPAALGSGWQFLEGDLTRDGAYHSIDLSTLYDASTTTKYVSVKVMARTSAAADGNDFILRGAGDANTAAHFRVCPAVSGIPEFSEGLVPVVGGVIEYNIPSNFAIARILFRGVVL